ncbi:MAG: hypothetical protein WAV53_23435, partial [Anaerolineae bacterium]
QALATSRRVERLSENRTVPTGCVRFANDHKLLYGVVWKHLFCVENRLSGPELARCDAHLLMPIHPHF